MKGFQGLGMDLWCQRWYWHWCEPVDCDMDVGCAVWIWKCRQELWQLWWPRSFVDTRMLDMSSLLKEEEVQLFRFIIRSPMAVESDNEHVRVPRFAVVRHAEDRRLKWQIGFRSLPVDSILARYKSWWKISSWSRCNLKARPVPKWIKMGYGASKCSVISIFLKLAFDSGKIIALRVCESPLKSLLNETGKRMEKGKNLPDSFNWSPSRWFLQADPLFKHQDRGCALVPFETIPARTLLGSGTGWKRPSLECYPVPNDASKTQCWLP